MFPLTLDPGGDLGHPILVDLLRIALNVVERKGPPLIEKPVQVLIVAVAVRVAIVPVHEVLM